MNNNVKEICAQEDAARFLSWRKASFDLCKIYAADALDITWASPVAKPTGKRGREDAMPKELPVVRAYITDDKMKYLSTYPADGSRLKDWDLSMILLTEKPSSKERASRWPVDFDSEGNVRPNRMPIGKPVITVWHGVAWIPVFGRYYILSGDGSTNWLTNTRHGVRDNKLWVGLIAATDEQIDAGLVLPQTSEFITNAPEKPSFSKGGWVLHNQTLVDIRFIANYAPKTSSTDAKPLTLKKNAIKIQLISKLASIFNTEKQFEP